MTVRHASASPPADYLPRLCRKTGETPVCIWRDTAALFGQLRLVALDVSPVNTASGAIQAYLSLEFRTDVTWLAMHSI